MTLQGKAAIVTGGDSGIGHAISAGTRQAGSRGHHQLPQERDAAAATVKAIEAAGGKAQAVQADVSRWRTSRSSWTRPSSAFGRLDIMVNNAGMETRTSMLETTEHQFDMVIGIDLKSAFFGVHSRRSR